MNADHNTSIASQVDGTETGAIRLSNPAPKKLLPVTDVGWHNECGPYAINFVYPKGKAPFVVKGAMDLVREKVKAMMMGVPHIIHWQHFKDGNPWGGVRINIPNSANNHFYLAKRHYRPQRETDGYVSALDVPLDPIKDKHEKWFLSVHNWRRERPPEVIATFRQPPRGWIRQLDRFLNG